MYLRVRTTGGRSWVLRRKRGGHVEVITVGAWPALGLAQARIKAGALAGKDVSTLTLGALPPRFETCIDLDAERAAPTIATPKLSCRFRYYRPEAVKLRLTCFCSQTMGLASLFAVPAAAVRTIF